MKEIDSKAMYGLSAFAILSVICAHMKLGLHIDDSGYIADKIIDLYGTIGVGAFFIKSGLFFHWENGDTLFFLRKKINSIIVPWLIWGNITKIVADYISNSSFSLRGQIQWVLGYKSLYYFVPVLIELFILFKFAKTLRAVAFLIIMGIISNILTIAGFLRTNEYFTPYMNPFNWVPFFGIGVGLRLILMGNPRGNKLNKKNMSKCLALELFFVFTIGVFVIVNDLRITYWESWSILFELLGIGVIYYIAWWTRNISFLGFVGRNSFFIYLTHIQVCGVINTRLPNNGFFYFIKPILALGVMSGTVCAIIWAAKLIKKDRYLSIVGIKK